MTAISRHLRKFAAPKAEVRVVHSSDIHVGETTLRPAPEGDGMAGLGAVLAAALALKADVAVLAGDTFEHNRLSAATVNRAAVLLAEAGLPVVILPGNHDPATIELVFRHASLASLANVHVLGVTHDQAVLFPALKLEIWGNAHRDYDDMDPLRRLCARRSFWQIAVAHGHYEPKPNRATNLRPSWLIGDDEIAATGADYVALGHWNRYARVGNGGVEAHYSGSPDLAGTVNLVRLGEDGTVTVTREPI